MKAQSGCWTCKSEPRSSSLPPPISLIQTERKIGCDKTIPNCNNCSRTRRKCLGYGLRLTWPGCRNRNGRGRDALTYEPPSSHATLERRNGTQFISFEEMDILASKQHAFGLDLWTKYLVGRPQFTLSLHSPIVGQDAILLDYYESVISTMVSTTSARNGFSHEILPMALSCRDASTSALSNAMLAISAYHHLGPESAAQYKSDAVSRLSESFSGQDSLTYSHLSDVQLAACLMLAMYSVFDKNDGSWHIHLHGSSGLIQMSAACQHRNPSTFLLTWLLYYEVLGNFAHPSHISSYDVGAVCIQGSKLEGNYIIGHLGCSVEILEIIHEINGLRSRTSRCADNRSSQPSIESRIWLDGRLQALIQRLHPDENLCTTPAERCRTLITAELYRLATILYLQRVCPMEGDHARRVGYLDQAFDAYAKLQRVSSPWPLFVVACESRKDEQRLIILEILDEMDRARSIGNISDMRKAIEMYWKQCDLRVDMDQTRQLEWWRFVDCGITVPWFV
ncbi:unnamed protein product [Clonostachys byssicola]|uniref:Zn(2)-C6 fungal-type domain-containing protein n=1 Tax=Clonostachys byssicola TaxID=160290 RepID=A0A9N9UFD1_9HYPO|nr:unnamed protein product [Clonostachys byssicola]